MKSTMKWWLVVGMALLTMNDVHAQNTYPWPSSGSVGIGIASPARTLHVVGSDLFESTNIWGTIRMKPSSSSYNGSNQVLDLYENYDVSNSAYALFGMANTAWGAPISSVAFISTRNGSGVTKDMMFWASDAAGLGSGNPALTIKANTQNVGIGTTTPGQKLSVAGIVESTSGGFKFPDGTVQTTAASGSGSTSPWTTSGSNIYNSNSGGVGIGTSPSSSYKLDVAGAIRTSSYLYSSSAYGFVIGELPGFPRVTYTSTSPAFSLLTGANGPASLNTGGIVVTNAYNVTPPTNGMYVQGNVGIGTTTPGQKLSVAGTVESTAGGFKFPDGSVQTRAASGWSTSGNDVYSSSSGSVGIGTSSPFQKLDVRGRLFVSYAGFGGVSRTAPSQAGSIIELAPGDYESARNSLIYTGLDQSVEKLTFDPGSGPLMTLDGGGKVGIGTTTPGQKLSVAGTVESTTGGFKFPDGSVQTKAASGWSTSSDNIYSSNSGNVGIGTSSPTQRLDVNGAIAISGTSVIDTCRNIVNAGNGAFNGSVIIGNRTTTSYKLDIVGNVRANEVVVNTDGSDFVFEEGYKLMDLACLADYIKQNKHLPDIAPADDMRKSGVSVGDMQTKLLQKIEELTLYVIAQDKKIAEQNRRILRLEKENAELRSEELR